MRLPLAILLACAAAPLAADTITLKSGATMEGEIISREAGKVRFTSNGSVYTLPESNIISITESEPWRAELKESEAKVRGGDSVRGVEQLANALRAGAAPAMVEDAFRLLSGRLMQSASVLKGIDSVDFRFALRECAGNTTITDDTRFMLAQIFHQADDTETALREIQKLGADWIRADESRVQWTSAILRAEIRRASRNAEFDVALDKASLLEELTGAGRDGQLPVVLLAQASRARMEGNYTEALAILSYNLAPLSGEIARNRLQLVLRDLEGSAKANGDFAGAREALKAAEARFPIEVNSTRMRLYAVEAEYLLNRDQPREAFLLLDAIPEAERSEELSAMHLRADYEQRYAALNPQEPLELMELGRWCAKVGLIDEGIAIFRRITDNPTLQELAIRQLQVIENQRDLRDLEIALDLYDKGFMREAAEITGRMLADGAATRPSAEETKRLDRVARRDMDSESRRRPYLAEVSYQQAERAYYTDEYDRALDIIDMILKQYGDTPAAERAKGLLPSVLEALELAHIEGRRPTLPALGLEISAARVQSATRLREEIDALLAAYDAPPRGLE